MLYGTLNNILCNLKVGIFFKIYFYGYVRVGKYIRFYYFSYLCIIETCLLCT